MHIASFVKQMGGRVRNSMHRSNERKRTPSFCPAQSCTAQIGLCSQESLMGRAIEQKEVQTRLVFRMTISACGWPSYRESSILGPIDRLSIDFLEFASLFS